MLIFLFIKESWKKTPSPVLNIENCSEGSRDTEDWSNDAENVALSVHE